MRDEPITGSAAARDALVDQLYEIASEPAALDTFIESWARSGRREVLARSDDPALLSHLTRAQAFLGRLAPAAPDLDARLAPYERFCALIVDRGARVLAANAGARAALGVGAGDGLAGADLPADVLGRLAEIAHAGGAGETLLRMDRDARGGAVLFRVAHLDDLPAVLVVSTQFNWSEATDALLARSFDLTAAEGDVLRLLVRGLAVKAIAETRGTTEGTARGQVKSILRKMELRSQADIVRVTVMLGEMPGPGARPVAPPTPGIARVGSLEAEMWKPFRVHRLPDGRRQVFHDMGPPGGRPVLLSHLGSTMVRWTGPMLRRAFAHDLRIVCPLRAGYGGSDLPPGRHDPFELTTADTVALLDRLGIARLPHAAQGSDFPLAAHLAATHPGRVTRLIGLGGRPCLPGGVQIEGRGAWQRFFLAASRGAPRLAEFAAAAVMAMSRRIGPAAMLRQLCRDSPADMALLEDRAAAAVLEANVALMSDAASDSARAFAHEYIAFQDDWSGLMRACADVPTEVYLADQDPTFDLSALPALVAAYPRIRFEVIEDAGLALLYQHADRLVPLLAKAAGGG